MTARILTLIALGVATGLIAQEPSTTSEFRNTSSGSLPDQDFGLSLLWDRDLGSGYSNLVIAGGKAVTMFTDEEVDVVAAIDPASGEELWRYQLGPKYAGHDGSDDGPLSTPAISGDRVFVLSPRGQLLALALADGSELWRRELDEQNSTPPFYGYSSSPVTSGDLVILATGGDGHAVTAFDQANGETRWAAGKDSVTYQSPLVIELGGEPILVLATDHLLQGFDPQTGTVRFEHRHTEGQQGEETSHVIAIDDETFVVNFQAGSVMYQLAAETLEEVWRSRAFANTLAIPVLFEDHLYGFTGRFMTCAKAATGEILWRSRPPLGQGIVLVDDQLVVLAASGDLVVIEPSPEGYREVTRISALENGDYATATFSAGVFFVRNLAQVAAIGIDAAADPQVATGDPTENLKGELAAWVASVAALPEAERQDAVDKRFGQVETSPLIESGGIAHFFWRGDVEDVGLEGGEIAPEAENGLYNIPGTDVFLRSAELDPKAQYTYALTIDYEDPVPDPRNPFTVDNGFNVVSELRMPDWPASPHLDSPAEGAPRGELDTFPFHSDILDNTRKIQVWRPPGYGADPAVRYPLLVVNHGDNLLRGGLMQNTLDNLVGESVAPLIAVFVPRVAPAEYGGPQVDDYVRFLVEELIPHLDHHYLTDEENRAIMGPGSAGVTAVYAALQHSEVFQQAAAQSFYPIEPAQERFAQLTADADPRPRRIYLVWSRHDYTFPDGRSSEDATRNLTELLRQEQVLLTEQVADYSPGWGGWRGQHDEILRSLFPIPESSASTQGGS